MNLPLEGKIAFVTGASRGIGRAVALELAARGADVAVAARGLAAVEETAGLVRDTGRRALPVALDVSDEQAVAAAAKQTADQLGKVSILVNNAGVTRDQLLMRMKSEEWDQVLRINLYGTFNCTKAFVRDMMRERWGRIINISSIVGTMGNAGQANYAASKAAIHGFTRSVARELAGRGITSNAIAPGYIDTDMTGDLGESIKESLLASIPLGRMGAPEDIARVVGFFAGDDSAYITGQVIHVDGGMVMA